MLARKYDLDQGTTFSSEFIDQVLDLLHLSYEDYLKKNNKIVLAYGFSFSEEVLLIASFMDKDEETARPLSFFVSVDKLKNENAQKLFVKALDCLGGLLDHTLHMDEDDIHVGDYWSEEEFKSFPFYYKINRENIALTLEAEKLLSQ